MPASSVRRLRFAKCLRKTTAKITADDANRIALKVSGAESSKAFFTKTNVEPQTKVMNNSSK